MRAYTEENILLTVVLLTLSGAAVRGLASPFFALRSFPVFAPLAYLLLVIALAFVWACIEVIIEIWRGY